MAIPYLDLIVMSVCAIVFYRAGRLERSWGLLWAALSILASLIALRLHWGLVGALAGQVVLFVGITVYRMVKR